MRSRYKDYRVNVCLYLDTVDYSLERICNEVLSYVLERFIASEDTVRCRIDLVLICEDSFSLAESRSKVKKSLGAVGVGLHVLVLDVAGSGPMKHLDIRERLLSKRLQFLLSDYISKGGEERAPESYLQSLDDELHSFFEAIAEHLGQQRTSRGLWRVPRRL